MAVKNFNSFCGDNVGACNDGINLSFIMEIKG